MNIKILNKHYWVGENDHVINSRLELRVNELKKIFDNRAHTEIHC